MKCSASPTISTAASIRSAEAARARELVSAVLFRSILAPLAQPLGPLGDAALDALAQRTIAERPR